MVKELHTTIKVSSKGQIAIPKEFRAVTGIEMGSEVSIDALENGSLLIRPITGSIVEIFGAARGSKLRESLSADDEAIMSAVLEEDERTKSGPQK